MNLGKINFTLGDFLPKLEPIKNDMFSLGRAYCGPHNANLLLNTVEIQVPAPWRTTMYEQVQTLLVANGYADYDDLRETVLCVGGKGNSGITYRMNNYLDMGVRVHVSLRASGRFEGPRTVEYEASDAIMFSIADSGKVWKHVYEYRCEQVVFVLLHKSQKDIASWRAFADYEKAKEL